MGNRNVHLKDMLRMLQDVTGRPAPRLRLPYWLALGAGYLDQIVEGSLMGRQPRIPLEGLKVARHPMYVSAEKSVCKLGIPQQPIEAALEKAVRWFIDHNYAKPAPLPVFPAPLPSSFPRRRESGPGAGSGAKIARPRGDVGTSKGAKQGVRPLH